MAAGSDAPLGPLQARQRSSRGRSRSLAIKKIHHVMDALEILGEWKHELGVKQVKSLLHCDDESLTGAVASYAFALGQEKYVKLLPDEYRRANETVAEANLKLCKSVFVENEPIEFEFCIANRGPGRVGVNIKYPSLTHYDLTSAVSFDLAGTKLRYAGPN